jgi:hypothetical protein
MQLTWLGAPEGPHGMNGWDPTALVVVVVSSKLAKVFEAENANRGDQPAI